MDIKENDVTVFKKQEDVQKNMFNSKGEIDNSLDESEAAAMTLTGSNRLIFKVAVDNKGSLYDPQTKESLSKLDNRKIRKYKLKEVNKSCFDTYLSFLKNNQESIYNIAQRELI